MLKTVFLALTTLLIAIGGGAGSLYLFIKSAPPIGAVESGSWIAFPDLGTPHADPYSRARFAREGGIPLGRSEGIVFTASKDSAGRILNRQCTYQVEGAMPPAQHWILHLTDLAGASLPSFGRKPAALSSETVLRRRDSGLTISISPHPKPDNWIPSTGQGAMQVVLTLLDTPVSAGFGITGLTLPAIKQVSCDA
ncbi:DUF1214 domain-containing protein [Chelativorans sp. J32]|uniref:DUF1214 domain-containing protein n=1 Tax=Chelativorans sp. J32 TaxID=935840 RepID=UPI0004819D5F|nr:DUF1214 domain-containing protein [Chelativorans sp. J32]